MLHDDEVLRRLESFPVVLGETSFASDFVLN
jgi:hypothetical protein